MLLSGLFEVWPGVNWYTFFLVSLHLCAATAVAWCVLQLGERSQAPWFLVVLWVAFELRFLVNLQFTHSAAAASFAGLAVILIASVRSAGWTTITPLILGVALAWSGALVRLPAFLMVGVLVAPAMLLPTDRRGARRRLAALAGLALAVGVSIISDRVGNDTPGWREYREFWAPMSVLYDGPLVIDLAGREGASAIFETAIAEVDWSERDWTLLRDYRFPQDHDAFPLPDVSVLSERLVTRRQSADMFAHLWRQESDFTFLPAILAVACIPLVILGPRARQRYLVFLAATAVVGGLAVVGLLYAARLSRQVRMPMTYAWAAQAALAAAWVPRRQPGRAGRLVHWIAALVLLLGLGLGGALLWRDIGAQDVCGDGRRLSRSEERGNVHDAVRGPACGGDPGLRHPVGDPPPGWRCGRRSGPPSVNSD